MAATVDNYQGAKGRPPDALESIMVTQSTPSHSPLYFPKGGRDRAAQIIQRCQKYWTAPRTRSFQHDPVHPNQAKFKPGSTRFPGYELSTREGIAMHYLLENGRLACLLRSMEQLRLKNITLSETTILPLMIHAKNLDEPQLACALLVHAEQAGMSLSARTYDVAIELMAEAGEVDLAEAIVAKALKANLRPSARNLHHLEKLGSHTAAQWQAKWAMRVLHNHQAMKKGAITHEAISVVITRNNPPNREVLCDVRSGIAIHSPGIKTFEGMELGTDACSLQLKQLLQNIQLGCDVELWLDHKVKMHPMGQTYAQIRGAHTPGDHPVPNPRSAYLYPRDVWREDEKSKTPDDQLLHVRMWTIQLSSTGGQQAKGVWLPADEAFFMLSRTDPQKQWADLLGASLTALPDNSTPLEPSKHKRARLLVGCEESMVVNSRFRRAGLVESSSIDMVAPEHLGVRHYVGDVSALLFLGSWDALIAFPPCTYLALSSGIYLPRPGRRHRLQKAVMLFRELWNTPIPHVAIENPKHSAEARRALEIDPTQTIHPHNFASPVCKPTQLFLRNLPVLQTTQQVSGRLKTLTTLPPTPMRGMIRARTFEGIAEAMVAQWTDLLIPFFEGQRQRVRAKISTSAARESAARGRHHQEYAARDAQLVATAWLREYNGSERSYAHACAAMKNRLHQTAEQEFEPKDDTPFPLHHIFNEWKRQAELDRGRLFTTRECPLAPKTPVDKILLLAGQLVRESGKSLFQQEAENAAESESDQILLHPSLPILPIKRVMRRAGSWWAWVSANHPLGHKPSQLQWVKVPSHLNSVLESTTKLMQPQIVAANWRRIQARSLNPQQIKTLEINWRHMARQTEAWHKRIRLESAARQFGQTRLQRISVFHGVARNRTPCIDCGLPRSEGGCPRGLGAITCKNSKVRTTTIAFTKAQQADRPKSRPPVVAATVTREAPRVKTASSSKQGCVLVDETTEPELIPLHLPPTYGEDAISNTPPTIPGTPTVCAWLRDVLISTRNPRDEQGKTPYLVGRAGAWAPAAIGDTGATISLIGTELLERLPADAITEYKPPPLDNTTDVAGPNGEPLQILGQVSLLITISKVPFRHDFLIVQGGDLLLIGCDFLGPRHGDVCLRTTDDTSTEKYKDVGFCALNHPKYGRVRLPLASTPEPVVVRVNAVDGRERPPVASDVSQDDKASPSAEIGPRNYLLYNQIPMRVAPRSEREILLVLPKALQDPPYEGPLLVRPLREDRKINTGVLVAYSFGTPRQVKPGTDLCIPVRVLNLSREPATLQALTPLAELELGWAAQDNEVVPVDEEEVQKVLSEVSIDPDGILTPQQLEKARATIAAHYQAFAHDPRTPGTTHAMEVSLPLKEGAVPHRHAPPRLGMEARKWVREHVAELEKRGIVYRTTGSWASRIVLVKKKSGELRMCCDYRELNQKLLQKESPLPRIDACLEAMAEGVQHDMAQHPEIDETEVNPDKSKSSPATERPIDKSQIPFERNWKGRGPRYWSSCDLASGFHGLPLAKDSQELTGFVTPDGRYAWRRLPFGVSSGPSAQVELMNNVFSGLQYSIAIIYLDDTLWWAHTFEEALERTSLILERFIAAGLTCKASKCIFFAKCIDFLGHRLSQEGIGVSPEKVKAIMEIDPKLINDVTAVRSFLGAASYYRKFLKGFATTARPLIDLTKKGCDVATESQKQPAQNAIAALKTALCTAPVLALPRWDRRFIIHSDGSTLGIGAVLCQENDDGVEQPICYYGRVLTPAESRYTVTEIELLALISCIAKWRAYLWSYNGKPFLAVVDHAALLWLATAKDTAGGGPASRLQRWFLQLQEYNFVIKHRPGRIHYDADMLSRLQGNPESWKEYSKLIATREHVSWLKVQEIQRPETLRLRWEGSRQTQRRQV